MTRRLRLLSLAILVLGIALLPIATAGAEPRITTVHCTEVPYGPPSGGTETHPGGNWHMRGMHLTNLEICDDPRINGDISVPTVNWNFQPNPDQPAWPWKGPQWGTWQSTNPPLYGEGVVVLSGTFTMDLREDGSMVGHVVGTGSGPLTGILYDADFYAACFFCPPEYTGRIIEIGQP